MERLSVPCFFPAGKSHVSSATFPRNTPDSPFSPEFTQGWDVSDEMDQKKLWFDFETH